MKPYYEHAGITIYHGDNREWTHTGIGAVVSDPPYGMGWNTRTDRFSGGSQLSRSKRGVGRADWGDVQNDDKPFDPAPWLGYEQVILWGSNHYAQRLPVGTTLVWIKRLDGAFGSFLSDAEVAWMKGGYGVYCFRDLSQVAEARDRVHPTQKPLPLMTWCVQKTEGVILDPFMGSGTTLVAAKNLGRKAIGIEIEEKYCEIAAKRLSQEVFEFVSSAKSA